MSVNNENYESANSNYYNYISKTSLIKNIDYYLNETTINKIEICAYEVNNQGVYPFLQFLLMNENDYRLIFPYISLNTYANNTTEEIINLATKMGFKKEALLRQNLFFNGKFIDSLIFGLLKNEWKSSKIT